MLSAVTERAMQVGRYSSVFVAAFASVLGACFPSLSQEYACTVDEDCDPDRMCSPEKFCVIRSGAAPDANMTVMTDAAVDTMVSIDADPFAATRSACMSAGYVIDPTTTNLYRAITTNASWNDAKTDCDNDVPNATHLIVLSTMGEIAFMKARAGSWVGLTDQGGPENTFRNATGETTVINVDDYWDSGQPDNGGGNEDCAQMKAAGLDDDQCGNGHRYVCECDGRPPAP